MLCPDAHIIGIIGQIPSTSANIEHAKFMRSLINVTSMSLTANNYFWIGLIGLLSYVTVRVRIFFVIKMLSQAAHKSFLAPLSCLTTSAKSWLFACKTSLMLCNCFWVRASRTFSPPPCLSSVSLICLSWYFSLALIWVIRLSRSFILRPTSTRVRCIFSSESDLTVCWSCTCKKFLVCNAGLFGLLGGYCEFLNYLFSC